MLELRTLTPDDWKSWRELRLAALTEAPLSFGARLADWQGDGDREDRWRARLGIPRSYNVLAVLDGEPVGMVSGVPTDDERTVELISMYVTPAGRGRGVGDELVRAVQEWALRSGAEVLRLSVAEGNDPATGLYRRNGFTDTGRFGDLMPDGVRREHIMDKRLPAR